MPSTNTPNTKVHGHQPSPIQAPHAQVHVHHAQAPQAHHVNGGTAGIGANIHSSYYRAPSANAVLVTKHNQSQSHQHK